MGKLEWKMIITMKMEMLVNGIRPRSWADEVKQDVLRQEEISGRWKWKDRSRWFVNFQTCGSG